MKKINIKKIIKESVEDVMRFQDLSQKDPGVSKQVYQMMQQGMSFDDAVNKLGVSALVSSPGSQPRSAQKVSSKPKQLSPFSNLVKPTSDPLAQQNPELAKKLPKGRTFRPSAPSPSLPNSGPVQTNPELKSNLDAGSQEAQPNSRMFALRQRHKKFQNSPQYQQWFKNQPQDMQQQISQQGQRTMKQENLQKAVSKALVKEQKIRKSKGVIKEELRKQLKVKMLAESYLNEMNGLSSVWQGMKSAGNAFADKLGLGGMTKQAGMSDAEKAHQEKVKKIQDYINSAIKKAEQARQKFNGQILKNQQMLEDYYKSVMAANQVYGQFVGTLGAAGQEPNRRIDELVNNLRNDLMSEIDQIKTMFDNWNLGDVDKSLDKMHKNYKAEREEERSRSSAPLAKPGRPYRAGPLGPTGEEQIKAKAEYSKSPQGTLRRLKGNAEPKPDEKKLPTRVADVGGKFVPGDVHKRVSDTDSEYKATDKKLIQMLMQATDPEERKRLAQRLVRHRNEMKKMGVNKKSTPKKKAKSKK